MDRPRWFLQPFDPVGAVCAWGDVGDGGCACEDRPSGGEERGWALSPRLMSWRPSDRRSPGRNPGPRGAFEVSMINVSCNSH